MRRNKTETTTVGVCMGIDVMGYLKSLELEYGCSRSFLINCIIREHAAQTGAHERKRKQAEPNPKLSRVIRI